MEQSSGNHVDNDLEDISNELADHPEVLSGLSDNNLDDQALQIRTAIMSKTWHGPIPSPEDLDAINKAVPGSGEKIVDAGIRAMDADIELKKSSQSYSIVALILAGIIAIVLLVFGFILIYNDKPVSGTLFAASPVIISFVGLFVINNKSNH
ncbi:hypothetical protein ACX2QB_08150 [Weissella viridescens]